MTAPAAERTVGGGLLTAGLFGGTMALLGLLGDLPFLLGPTVGVAAVVASTAWRRSNPRQGEVWGVLPALAALALLAVAAPVTLSTELAAGVGGLAALLWLADDPARPSGGGRRAVPAIALAALSLGLAWSIVLIVPSSTANVGLAGGLLAFAIVLVALLLAPRHARNA